MIIWRKNSIKGMTDNMEESKRNSFTEGYTRKEHKMTSRSRKRDYNYKKMYQKVITNKKRKEDNK